MALSSETIIANREKRNTPEYSAWSGLRTRCTNSKRKNAQNYIGRGITYDPAWDSFDTFLADMGPRPNSTDTLDRIDVNGNYCKENCRWASKKIQANNKTNNNFITYKDKTLTLTQWADELRIYKETLRERIYSRGWTIEQALTTPVKTKVPRNSALRYIYQGEMKTLIEISRLTGVNISTLKSRLKRGKTLEQAINY